MFNSDIPIKEQADDRLNRKTIAQRIAHMIFAYDSDAPFVFGLYGKWGSGKTSVINMICQELKSLSEEYVVFNFNPWNCSSSEQITEQFFKQLSNSLEKYNCKELMQAINCYGGVINIASLFSNSGKAVALGGKTILSITKAIGENNNLEKEKNKLIKKLNESKKRILVTIDDIDRLSEDEICKVFQLVKGMADLPYMVYLLSFDYEVVVGALNKLQPNYGEAYLEKVIQVPFRLPDIEKDELQSFMFDRLEEVIDQDDRYFDEVTWTEYYEFGVKHFINNLRDVNRFFNVFIINYSILKNEVNISDLLAITALEVFEPRAFVMIPGYYELLCGNSVYDSNRESLQKKEIDEMNKTLSDAANHPKAFMNLLGGLFPVLRPFTNTLWCYSTTYDENKYAITGKIAYYGNYYKYFSLKFDTKTMSIKDLRKFVYYAEKQELKEITDKYVSSGHTNVLLSSLKKISIDEADSLKKTKRPRLILDFFVEEWNCIKTNNMRPFYISNENWNKQDCIKQLLKLMCKNEIKDYLINCFDNDNVSLEVLATIIQLLEIEKTKDEELIDSDLLISLERKYLERVKLAIEKKVFLYGNSIQLQIRCAVNINADYIKPLLKNSINTDEELSLFVNAFVLHGVNWNRNNSAIRSFDEVGFEQYFDIHEANRRLRLYWDSEEFRKLDYLIQDNVISFLVYMEKREDSPDDSISITESDIAAFRFAVWV